jgi:ATP-binding cassette subfamily F protein uup
MSLLSARGVSKAYGARTLFQSVDLTVREGERVGVLGINGTGKSTLLRVLAGEEPMDTGVLEVRRGAKVLYLPQEPVLPDDATAREVIASGLAEWEAATREHAALSEAISKDPHDTARLARQAELGETIERLGGWDRSHVVEEIAAALGIVPLLDRKLGQASGGEKRRVALARLLVAKPALAILDEPTNHLDAETIDWLEKYLKNDLPGSVVMVTHDRFVLDAVCDRIFELDRGTVTEFDGNYTDYVERKAELLAHEERVEKNRQNFLRRETEWLRRGPKARTTKQKARIQRAEAAIADKPREDVKTVDFTGIDGNVARLGKSILDLEGVGVSLGGRELVSDLTLHLVAGDRIGVVGRNGVGKTTLLRLLTGELVPDRGAVKVGANTKVALFDQARSSLEDDWTVYDNVAGHEGALSTGGGQVDLGTEKVDLRVYLEGFLFDGHKQRQKVSSLSGGERARVALAKVLREGKNLVLLDEPTNDLDVATLSALEDLLETWPGCAIVVSHDRAFLDNVATAILSFEGDGKTVLYQGGYSTYKTLKAEALAREAERAKAAEPAPVRTLGDKPAKAEKIEAAALGPKPLTYAERIELEGLLEKVASAEDTLAALEAKLADPELYTKRAADAPALREQTEKARAEVERLMARWEDLEARRDAKR